MSNIKVIIDDFRISNIFDIEDPIPERQLADALQSKSYKVINDRVISHPPIRAIILNIATKNNVNIVYQKETVPSYIGTSGKDMKEVVHQFDILNSILTNIDPTLQGRYTSIEMVMIAKVFGSAIPKEIMAQLGSTSASKFDQLFGRKMKTHTISMYGDDKASESHYSLTLAPLVRSQKYYYAQLSNREKDLQKIIAFANKGEQVIKDAISILEQG